jgi:hypothetical protein
MDGGRSWGKFDDHLLKPMAPAAVSEVKRRFAYAGDATEVILHRAGDPHHTVSLELGQVKDKIVLRSRAGEGYDSTGKRQADQPGTIEIDNRDREILQGPVEADFMRDVYAAA